MINPTEIPDDSSETPPDWTWEELMLALARELRDREERVRERIMKQVARGLYAAYPPSITVAELTPNRVWFLYTTQKPNPEQSNPVIERRSWFTDEDGVEELSEVEYQETLAQIEENKNWAGYYSLFRQTYRFALRDQYVYVHSVRHHGGGNAVGVDKYHIVRNSDGNIQFEFVANVGMN